MPEERTLSKVIERARGRAAEAAEAAHPVVTMREILEALWADRR
jgi:hypothetical protein